MTRAAAIVLVAFIIGLWTTAARAAVVINNWPNGTTGGSSVSDTTWKAMIFRSGSYTARIETVNLGLNPAAGGTPIQRKVEIALYSVVSGVPAAQLATTGLVTINLNQTRDNYSFNTATGFDLAPSTSYALVIRSDASQIKWGNTDYTPPSQPTGSDGFAFTTFLLTSDSGGTWSAMGVNSENAVQLIASILAAPVPMLSWWAFVSLALLFGLVLGRVKMIDHRR